MVMETAQIKILVAEDSRVNQMILVRILKQLGITSNVVSNGSEAVEAIKAETYDAVLMDVNMPVMDGIEATRVITTSNPAACRTKIIALTADNRVEERQKCLEVGMDDYITKPVQLDELINTLRKWIPSQLNSVMEEYRLKHQYSNDEYPSYKLTKAA
jgi:CheY-like chemotaxis protein